MNNRSAPHSEQEPDTRPTQPNPPPGKRRGWLVLFALFIAMVYFSRQPAVDTIDCTPEIMATNPDVVMLGAWWCSYCNKAKRYFARNKIHYCEYDMENTEEGKRLYQQHGGGAIPIILIGDYRLSGFNEYQIEQALQILKQQGE